MDEVWTPEQMREAYEERVRLLGQAIEPPAGAFDPFPGRLAHPWQRRAG
jgi:hypothetical protein